MKIQGIDCATPITAPVAAKLSDLGYVFACRYLVPAGYSKRLTADEARVLTDAGILILSVFETSAGRAKGGAANGQADGAAAFAAVQEVGMPESGVIYFAIDYEAQAGDMDAVAAYLTAAKSQLGPYGIGVYGSYDVVEAMAARGLCAGYWQTYAWSGGRLSKHANVYQYRNDQQAAGIGVDFDEAYGTAGLWNLKEENETDEYIEQIAQQAGVTTDQAVDALAVTVRHIPAAIDPKMSDAVYKMQADGLIEQIHDANAPVTWGELAVVADRLKK